MVHLLERKIARQLNLSIHQARTLIALWTYPAMNYDISETLGLYPRSKMRNRILAPLHQAGWILIHSVPSTGDTGASRVAWSLNTRRAAELESAIKGAEDKTAQLIRKATTESHQLSDELFGYDQEISAKQGNEAL